MAAELIPESIASATKPATRTSETRLAIVMVKKSLHAANAIIAGNSVNLIASMTMASPLVVPKRCDTRRRLRAG
jgi:hypothetical protein